MADGNGRSISEPRAPEATGELAALEACIEAMRAQLRRLSGDRFPFEQGIMLVDLDGCIRYATSGAQSLLGLPSAALVGAAEADVMAGLGLAGIAALRAREPEGLTETVWRPDGTHRVLRHRAVPLRETATGRDVGTLRAFHDATVLVERSAELAEKSRELDEARGRLMRAQHLKTLGELAAEVAHEFGNLLQAIGLQGAALRRQPALPESVRRAVWSIKQAVDIGHSLTRRLLTFARDDPNERMATLDLGRVLRDLVQLLQPRMTQHGRPIAVELSLPDLPELYGNENKLTEVFLNLFLNAMDAMPDGGRLRVSAVERSGEVKIAVEDTGKGMSPEELARAFDPFFTTKPGGTGLGLSTVYGVVRAHRGSVFMESQPGNGTRVFVSLPTLVPPEAMRAAPRPRMGDGGRVLIVDDHPTVREATCELLTAQGYAVESASTVADALAAIERERFSVVVTDVGLPDRPGWEVARATKRRSASTVVVLVTGWGSHFSVEEARARGADLVFEKPVDPDVLLSAIGTSARPPEPSSGRRPGG